MWGVTVQNEAEAADVGWEKCVYTPEYMAQFVKNHLGPVLHAEQPGVKIIGFDHNKDHVVTWADALYADPDAKAFFDGIGVHWYGGLNTHNLDNAHAVAPDKFLLATEACNCPGVMYEASQPEEWWQRAGALLRRYGMLRRHCTATSRRRYRRLSPALSPGRLSLLAFCSLS